MSAQKKALLGSDRRTCNRCGTLLEISLESVFKSWEDEDKNRHYPLPCSSQIDCHPVIVRDGGTGRIQMLKQAPEREGALASAGRATQRAPVR